MKLSDTQLMILSAASQRDDHAAVLPPKLKGNAAKKVVDKLVNEDLLQELQAKDDMPVWRRGDDNRPYSLRITKAGLKAIAVDTPEESRGEANADDAGVGLVVQPARSKSQTKRQGRSGKSAAKKPSVASKRKATKKPASKPAAESKQDNVIALLRRPEGATLDALVKATNWQKHSVRGFLAGTVRKKLKLPLVSEKIDDIRTYRIGRAKTAKDTKAASSRAA